MSADRRQELLSLLAQEDLPPASLPRLASRYGEFLRDPSVQDALYLHPSLDLFAALEVTLHLGGAYFQSNAGPTAVSRILELLPSRTRAFVLFAWTYPWIHRWELRSAGATFWSLPTAPAEVFSVLFEDALLAGTVPPSPLPLRAWLEQLRASALELGSSRI